MSIHFSRVSKNDIQFIFISWNIFHLCVCVCMLVCVCVCMCSNNKKIGYEFEREQRAIWDALEEGNGWKKSCNDIMSKKKKI